MRLWKMSVLFYLGGSAYMALELLWRGRSHGTMFLAGGICFLLVGLLNRAEPRLPLIARLTVGGLVITMVELAVGMAANREYTIWDYRGMWGNFAGQICPEFTVLWILLSGLAMAVYDWLEPKLENRILRVGM